MIDVSAEWSEWMKGLSDERLALVRDRMDRAGVDWEDEDSVADHLESVTLPMYVHDLMQRAQARGIIEPDHINADGEVIYGPGPNSDVGT